MKVLQKRRILKSGVTFTAYISTLCSIACLAIRANETLHIPYDSIDVLSAKFVFPRGGKSQNNAPSSLSIDGFFAKNQENALPQLQTNIETVNTESAAKSESQPSSNDSSDEDDDKHSPNENTYKIIESQFGAGGTKYENFYVKNSANFNLNIASVLAESPDINIKSGNGPQVLIMHTHTSESYMKRDCGFFYESYYPRSTDNKKNVTSVGDEIAKKLSENGIATIHDTTYHDTPSYNGSYARSANTIKANLEKYPSIQVVLDIHRDSLGNRDTGKIKPTFKYNGKKAAQIMIIAGCDKDGSLGFPDWETNLRFALRLQQKAENMFPGITRPLNFNSVKYNMNLTHGSLLIEVGSDANTIDEAVYTGSLLGEALSEVLKSLK